MQGHRSKNLNYEQCYDQSPVIEKHLNHSMQDLEEKLNRKFAMMVFTINLNIDKRVEMAFDKITTLYFLIVTQNVNHKACNTIFSAIAW